MPLFSAVILFACVGVAQPIPVNFTLEKPGLVTLVVEDTQGHRIRNLIGETPFDAGSHTIYWDGYDEGRSIGASQPNSGNLIQQRVGPGAYRLRGLVHDRLQIIYHSTYNYTGFNTPWKNSDNTGAWLADHSSPLGIAFIPAQSGSPYGSEPQVLISSQLAETGHPLAWVSAQSLKTLQTAHYWGWEGANALAVDGGGQAAADIYAYALCGNNKSISIRALARAKPGQDLPGRHEILRHNITTAQTNEPRDIGLALAVFDRLAVASIPLDNQIAFFDTQSKKHLLSISTKSPRGVAFDKQGRLLVCSDRSVLRYELTRTTDNSSMQVKVSDPKPLILDALEEPFAIAVAGNGTIFVADHGKSHQVKIFSPTGRIIRAIGQPGGPQLGAYNERRMHHPNALALDDRGRLWVAENDWAPKRVSLWNIADGSLAHAWYGPPQYGGGGTIDPQNPNRLFYSTHSLIQEWQYDPVAKRWKLAAIPAHTALSNWARFPGPTETSPGNMPERPVHFAGRTYLVGSWNGALRGNDPAVTFLYDEKTQTARPVCFVGSDRWWWQVRNDPAIQKHLDQITGQRGEHFFAWSDLNGDGQLQLDEFTPAPRSDQQVEIFHDQRWQLRPLYGFRSFAVAHDLSLTGSWGIHIPSPAIRPDGVPVYDLTKIKYTVELSRDLGAAEDGRDVIPADNGWAISLGAYNSARNGIFGYRDRSIQWVFNEAEFPAKPGLIVQPTRLLGPAFKPAQGQADYLWAVSGERGSIFLITTDGLFIQTIAGDMRTTPLLRMNSAIAGKSIGSISFEDEHFHPTVTQSTDGTLWLVAGKEHSSVFQITGLDSVQRKDFGSITLQPSQLASLPAEKITVPQQQSRQTLPVAFSTVAPKIDGAFDEWASPTWADIRNSAQGAICVAGDKLFLAFRTHDANLLRNAGRDPQQLFASGGCLDLQLSTTTESDSTENHRQMRAALRPGDLRLLVTRVGSQPRAILYQPLVAGVANDRPIRFDSPIDSTTFARITDVTGSLQLAQREGDYELSIPLSVLNFKPQPGKRYLGDLGIIRSDGHDAIQRLYWNNLDTDLVSDIPTEARLEPRQWGWFDFTTKPSR